MIQDYDPHVYTGRFGIKFICPNCAQLMPALSDYESSTCKKCHITINKIGMRIRLDFVVPKLYGQAQRLVLKNHIKQNGNRKDFYCPNCASITYIPPIKKWLMCVYCELMFYNMGDNTFAVTPTITRVNPPPGQMLKYNIDDILFGYTQPNKIKNNKKIIKQEEIIYDVEKHNYSNYMSLLGGYYCPDCNKMNTINNGEDNTCECGLMVSLDNHIINIYRVKYKDKGNIINKFINWIKY